VIGTLIRGRYRLEDRIGSGGMSTVYRAFDETLERWVAIKVLHGALASDPLQLERFRREARTIARLSHPHIVTVIDAGEEEGQPFIVLEYVDGETLKARVKRLGRLGVIESIVYAIEIGRALTAAHALRLVHRDVKPQNVLIDNDGRAKVTDFGISRSLEDDGLTLTGRVLGTTDYVAPEQALGEAICEQSDVYSLGVCLYELLSGDVPFKAESQVGVAMKHVRDPLPDVRAARPEVSAALAAVVERATAKERDNRYTSATAMVADLEQALEVELARSRSPQNGDATSVLRPTKPPRRHRRRFRAVPALLVLLALGAAGAAAFELASRRHTHLAKAPAPPPADVRLTSATTFDPFGDGNNPTQAYKAIDGNLNTAWPTEIYYDGTLNKQGVGIYVQASRAVTGRTLEVLSDTPGARAQVFAAPRPGSGIGSWGRPVGTATLTRTDTRIPLSTARPASYYLLWITSLGPSNQEQIGEIRLFG